MIFSFPELVDIQFPFSYPRLVPKRVLISNPHITSEKEVSMARVPAVEFEKLTPEQQRVYKEVAG